RAWRRAGHPAAGGGALHVGHRGGEPAPRRGRGRRGRGAACAPDRRPPAGAARNRAGQTIDQIKLYGDSVRWFAEVGNHEADDAGLLHYRSVACRAYAASRGEPRPGPVHLNLPWREPLAPIPVEGQVTATSLLALEG